MTKSANPGQSPCQLRAEMFPHAHLDGVNHPSGKHVRPAESCRQVGGRPPRARSINRGWPAPSSAPLPRKDSPPSLGAGSLCRGCSDDGQRCPARTAGQQALGWNQGVRLTEVCVVTNGFMVLRVGTRATGFMAAMFEGGVQKQNLVKMFVFCYHASKNHNNSNNDNQKICMTYPQS